MKSTWASDVRETGVLGIKFTARGLGRTFSALVWNSEIINGWNVSVSSLAFTSSFEVQNGVWSARSTRVGSSGTGETVGVTSSANGWT